MAKSSSSKGAKKSSSKKQEELPPHFANLPKETQEKLKNIKTKLDKFQKQVIDKFGKYIVGITLLPPRQQMQQGQGQLPPGQAPPPEAQQAGPQPTPAPGGQAGQAQGSAQQAPSQQTKAGQQAQPNPDEISVLVLVDDSDSKKMTKDELRNKLGQIITNIGKDIDKNLAVEILILSDVWQSCYDAKYDALATIARGAPVYDTGMLQAIKIAEIHKNMVLRKFEKYIVSYVLAGSLVQGKATPTSDIDVWVVIDDTDVKKMTRVELKDKLRAIIIGMGIEAGEMTGIKNKLNIQVYILTDFWDSLKEANPVIFTLLRDGVPFYDRGIFMPWKQLLKLGKIKPSAEAIDMFLGSGEQMIRRVKSKLNEIGMEDIYYAILTPSQAALMMYGVPPPTPKETPEVMRDIFVKKEKLIEDKYVQILEKNVQVRKDIEHGTIKELSGKEVDDLLSSGEKYLKRIKRLFTQIEKIREEQDMAQVHDTAFALMRDALAAEGKEDIKEADLVATFENELISSGKLPSRYLRTVNDIIEARQAFENKDITKVEVEKVKKDAGVLSRALVEHIQRKRGRELEKAKIRVKYGDKYGEVLLLGEHAFITHDLDAEQKEVTKAKLTKEGGLEKLSKSSLEDMEKHLSKTNLDKRVFIKGKIFDDLKKVFGKDVEVLVSY